MLGNAQAQQTPAAKTQTAPAAKGQDAPATKTTPAAAAKKQPVAPLTTLKDRFSYALGLDLGTNLHRQSVDVDPNILAQGIKDAVAGGTMRLTPQEAQAALNEMQGELRKKQQAKMEANKAEGEAFLAANKTKEGVVTLPSGLQYKILKEGTGAKPTASDSVVCNYRGTLIDGTEFDSSYKRGQPTTFGLGRSHQRVDGSPAAHAGGIEVATVRSVGPGVWRAGGAARGIGPDSTLIFEVELLSIQSKEAEKAPEKAPESPGQSPGQSADQTPGQAVRRRPREA